MSDTLTTLADYIKRDILKQPNRTLAPDTKLISSGLVDSFSLVDLALFVQETFDVTIDDTELNAQTFDTLGQLTELVDSRRS